MVLRNPFKLEKLKINIYNNALRKDSPQDTFEAMFNPTSYAFRHENVFHQSQGSNTSSSQAVYVHSRSEELTLALVFDGTGVTDDAVTPGGRGTRSVSEQVDAFLMSCFNMDGVIHEPKFLKIQWGDGVLRNFDCRLQSVDITYTSFDKNGAPLRAELNTVFVEDVEPAKRVRQEGKSSPDLPHTRTVQRGDTLPLLTKAIYGSSAYYLRVAQVNGLDDFRNLAPGREIFFPPLEK